VFRFRTPSTNTRRLGRGGVVRWLRSRDALGRLGVLGYLFAFVVAPGAHTARHRADHWHDSQGATHALQTADLETAIASATPAPQRDAVLRARAPAHGAGGALHFATLFLDATSPALPSPVARLVDAAPAAFASRIGVAAGRSPRETRGPPRD
jgi:hypothetical protein